MLDINHLGLPPDGFTLLTATGSASDWQRWVRPRDCRFVGMLFLGSGGGGGGGGRNTAANAGGGGGGGSGGITRFVMPAFLLPDALWFSLGRGGAGGAGQTESVAGVAGSAGGNSFVAYYPNTAASLFGSGTTAVNGGGGGGAGGAAAGTAGTAATAATTTTILQTGAFGVVASSGLAGGGGGLAAAGTNSSLSALHLFRSGCGGAGQSATPAAVAGGVVSINTQDETGVAVNTILVPANAGLGAGSNTPAPGGFSLSRFRSVGGSGGSSAGGAASVGGRGGDGAWSCGGSGGGATVHSVGGTGTVGGAGGNGGDGLVLLWTW